MEDQGAGFYFILNQVQGFGRGPGLGILVIWVRVWDDEKKKSSGINNPRVSKLRVED